MIPAELSTGALVVFGLIAVALVLFVTEAIPTDVTAIGIIVSLAALEPVTGVGPRAAISGFANTATVTIVAMYMLSAAIQGTGVVQRLGVYLATITNGSEKRALLATICTTGPLAGFINNTPIVAIFVPMITDLAEKTGISPSKLLLPLSYAAILGGTLTLIGTSTNLLASEFAVELLGREPIGMFEFSALGVVILLVGLAYLATVGRWLTPARIPVDADLVEEFELEDHLATVRVRADSAPVGRTVDDLEARADADVRVLQLRRAGDGSDGETASADRVLEYDGEREATLEAGPEASPPGQRSGDSRTRLEADAASIPADGESFVAAATDERIREGDLLTVHGSLQAINRFVEAQRVHQLARESVTEETFEEAPSEDVLVKAVVPESSAFAGERLGETALREFFGTTVLAIRRGGDLLRTDLAAVRLAPGDLLLVQTSDDAIDHFAASNDLLVVDDDVVDRLADADLDEVAPLSPKTPIAVGIMAGVVGAAALGLVSIVIAAFAGVFLMVVSGCLSIDDAYDAVSWNVVFLLAGVIPLGIALEATGGSAVIATGLVSAATYLPLVAVLLLFTVVTGLLANVITPVATVVLMIPIAVDAATSLGAAPFSFLLAVLFASATSFMTPVGYQTNLMVYGPGGYEFTDFLRVGGPLQLLLAIVTTVGITVVWGL
ncbi:SLC13 family permease [Natrinema thermotolerans]|uniref:SLC13 family permease n=1 Tax=Natrinema thermotolerans TaxID=121872 RepID=A0AAF0P6P8_9EURY|nr:SLC13 family permease [Natrinema thermotolerans]QCC60899.1 SLC13 family permease [Natrinema thermotolerans]WMT06278.1 SLC13 family permease [Natrinema thermotolerans]